MTAAPTFSKRERMTSNLLIEALFENGRSHSASAFPLRAVFQMVDRPQDGCPAQILISVPKKRFKHAVDRNRVKRQIREAYRHHKQTLWSQLDDDKQLLIGFIWLSNSHFPSATVEKRVVGLLQRISDKI